MTTATDVCETTELDLDDLASAEDFLDYFGVNYDPAVVQVNRLHILQRFHNYLARRAVDGGVGESSCEEYRRCLLQAYSDFVVSDAMTEKVFRVHKRAAGIATIPVSAIGRTGRARG